MSEEKVRFIAIGLGVIAALLLILLTLFGSMGARIALGVWLLPVLIFVLAGVTLLYVRYRG